MRMNSRASSGPRSASIWAAERITWERKVWMASSPWGERVGLAVMGEKIVQHEVLPLGELGNQVPGGHPEEVLVDLEQFCG